ncbi:Pol protein [Phytophthora palmivora]|uniref:Pol protein n=1 Tax=Phytophthora palmivora TaxID=4796 RepID=A0A2P4YA42_9STRA|nr:Pol protein [Phytophthora palmivora]
MDRGEFPHLTDSQFESVRKMVGIFGGDALRSLAAATPAEQVERIEAFGTHERAHRSRTGVTDPVAEMEPAQPKPLRLNLRAAFLPANYEYRQRSRFLACKQGKRELHEYIQEMQVLAASLVGNPLPEHIKVTVFTDGLKVGPSRTQLFRVHANTMEEANQRSTATDRLVLLRRCGKATMRRQAQCKELQQLELAQGRYPWNWTVSGNGDQYADSLRESEGRGQVLVRLADGTVVNVPGVRMDLAVKFVNFDSTEPFLVLDMDKYDLFLGMPWLESTSPGSIGAAKSLGLAGPQSPTELWCVIFPPLSGPGAPEMVAKALMPLKRCWESLTPMKVLRPNAERRRAVRASTVAVPDGTDQAGNLALQAAEAAEESVEGVSGVGNIVPLKVEETEKKNENAACVSSVGNRAPHGVKKTSTRAEVLLNTSCVDNQVPHSESETPPARPVEELNHVFDGVSGRQVKADTVHLEALPEVSALLNREELSMKDFLAELKAGEIAEMVLLKPETSPEDLNSSSVMDEDVLEGFTKQRATRLGSEILKNPENPVYPLVKEYSDVVSKRPPSQLPPDRGVRHEFDLVSGTKYCVTRQWTLPRERCEVIDVFFAEKVKSAMVRKSKSPHSTPTFCVRKPNGKWRLVHTNNKLNNATVPAQTPIPRKDVLLNNVSGCTMYSALDLVDGYYQILMREDDIPLTAVSTLIRMLWEWLVIPQGLSNVPATFNRLVTQLFRPLRTFAQTYVDDIFVHSRATGGQTAMEVQLKHLRRVFEVMRANKLYANIDKCVFAAEEIKVVGVRADPGKVKAIAAWPTPRSQKDLRKWLCLAIYIHKYSAGYDELARSLSDLLKKDSDWVWEQQHQEAFDSIKASLQHAPVLALADMN